MKGLNAMARCSRLSGQSAQCLARIGRVVMERRARLLQEAFHDLIAENDHGRGK
jgi:hypothetical protein